MFKNECSINSLTINFNQFAQKIGKFVKGVRNIFIPGALQVSSPLERCK